MIYKEGSKGEIVLQIQRSLAGYGLGVYPDGIYGKITAAAVREFQKQNNLKADGIAGPATLAKILPFRLKTSRRTITDIVVHCTATKPYQDIGVEEVRRMHKAKGWSDIGYHYLIRIDGTREEGRNVDYIGAHVSGFNAHSIGVVYVGGIDNQVNGKDTRTENQKNALLLLLMDLKKLYPKAKISGHRDFSPDKNGDGIISPDEWLKECPCFNAIDEYRNI